MEWTVYLAAPIDQADSIVGDTRETLKSALHEAGATVFDPYRPDVGSLIGKGVELREKVRLENIEALRTCDAVLAYLPDNIPTIGVPVEIERARLWGKPIVALGGDALWNTPTWDDFKIYDIDLLYPSDMYAVPVQYLKDRVVEAKLGVQHSEHYTVPTSRPKAPPAVSQSSLPANGLRRAFYELVTQELNRAEQKHPFKTASNTTQDWFSVWIEEMVEVVQAWNDGQRVEVISELIQVGAMTQRFWESLVELPERFEGEE